MTEQNLIDELALVIGHEDWCHGPRGCCYPCTNNFRTCGVWETVEQVLAKLEEHHVALP